MLLTIQQFSEKTGLSPSTLRFYDKKELLVPNRRLENGYRAYNKEQISDAMMIHSLRNVDIQIDEIKEFLRVGEQEKSKLISKWRDDVHAKLSALKIAQQYLGGLTPKENAIQLIRWEEPVTFIWLPLKVQRKINPFRQAMISGHNHLIDLGFKLAPGYFLRILDSVGQEMTGEVGFLLQEARALPSLEEPMYVETWQPTLFACMECSSSNEFLCFQFIQLIRQYGFLPSGVKIEKYETPESKIFQYLIPLMNHKEL